MRAAFHDFARDLDRWLVRIVSFVSFSAPRIEARAAGLLNLLVLLIPVSGPLPNVAGHVVEPVAVRWKRSHRRRSLETILFEILPGKFALPGVGHVLAIRCKRIAPDEFRSVQSTTRGELPFSFRWQFFTDPFRIGFNILVGNVHDWVFRFSFQ